MNRREYKKSVRHPAPKEGEGVFATIRRGTKEGGEDMALARERREEIDEGRESVRKIRERRIQ